METYTEITDGQLAPGAPITVSLATALARNPQAIAEGALGAPFIHMKAFEKLTAGDVLRYESVGKVYRAYSTAYTTVWIWRPWQEGTVRMSFRLEDSNTSALAEITSNGVSVWFGENSVVSEFVVDLNLTSGHLIEFKLRTGSNGSDTQARLTKLKISTSGEVILPTFDPQDWIVP